MFKSEAQVKLFGVYILAFLVFWGSNILENFILPNYGKKTIAKTTDTSNDEFVYFKFCDARYVTVYGSVKRENFGYKGKEAKYYEISYWSLNSDVYKINLDKEIVDTSTISKLETSNWKHNSN